MGTLSLEIEGRTLSHSVLVGIDHLPSYNVLFSVAATVKCLPEVHRSEGVQHNVITRIR